MKKQIRGLLLGSMCLIAAVVSAQPGSQNRGGPGAMGGGMKGPPGGASMAKLFGDNKAFSADLELRTRDKGSEEATTIPGKFAFLDGKSRFDMDLGETKGRQMAPGSANQMKAMGMDKIVSISRPDKKATYMMYPGLQAYVEQPMKDSEAGKGTDDAKVETTELGRETVDGHPCVKNRTVVADAEGNKHESTVWNATDLNKFPVKIETTESGSLLTMQYKNIKLQKPEASLFEPPADFAKYDDMGAMMQQIMIKKFGADRAFPQQPPPGQ